MATTADLKKAPVVEYEVTFEWGDRAVFRAPQGSIFLFGGAWIKIPNASFANGKPVCVPREKVRMIVQGGA